MSNRSGPSMLQNAPVTIVEMIQRESRYIMRTVMDCVAVVASEQDGLLICIKTFTYSGPLLPSANRTRGTGNVHPLKSWGHIKILVVFFSI